MGVQLNSLKVKPRFRISREWGYRKGLGGGGGGRKNPPGGSEGKGIRGVKCGSNAAERLRRQKVW